MKFKEFLIKMFSEEGTVSFSRVITLIIVVFVLGWDTSYAVHTKQLPPSAELLGQIGFMSVFYVANKGAAVLSSKDTSSQEPGKQ